ncbi:MAG: hypothetical protein ABI354_02780 [Candidatus Saccharimonadales bacterium]
MLLITHIVIAVSSIIFATYLTLRPTKHKFYVSYGLITATLSTGTALVITSNSPLMHACISGVVYVSIVSALTIRAQRALAYQKI